jgi:glycosyltransferase involved in cell wall biosynthesis
MNAPRVSVLLPVYNGAADLPRALESVLGQTFPDFEVIAINDGSRDNSAELLNSITDSRVRVIHQDNMGLAATLNRGLSLARGALVARQDQDDLSKLQRFAKQIAHLDENPKCILLGTAAEIWIGDDPAGRAHDHPTTHPQLMFDLLFNNPFVHSSVMMQRAAVLELGGYSTDRARQPPEDYELWSRMARHGLVANLPERLLVYREVPQSMSRTGPNPFLDKVVAISAENLALARGKREADIATLDVAALTHSAFHRLSLRPNIRAMSRVVEQAGGAIAEGDPVVIARTAERVKILQYQWLMHTTGVQKARPILRGLRNQLRRLPWFCR